MLFMKFIKKNIFIYIIIISLFLENIFCDKEYNKEIDTNCTVNLQCHSGCCSSKKCVKTDECKSLTNKIYAIQAIVCAVLIVIICVYLIIKIFSFKNELKKIKEKGKQN